MDDKLISALKQRYNLPVTTDGLQLLKDEVDNVSVDSLYAEFLNVSGNDASDVEVLLIYLLHRLTLKELPIKREAALLLYIYHAVV